MEKKVKYGLISTIGAAFVNLGLALTKLYVGILSNSVSIFFDAVNNFLDIFGSIFGAFGIGLSNKKPDNKYPLGYGRMEYVMTFVITAITIAMGAIFIFYSVERLLFPFPVYFGWTYFGLLIMTVFIKLIMGVVFVVQHKRDKSDITKALYLDNFMDAGITGTTVICYALVLVVDTNIDAILGILIGITIFIPAIKMLIRSVKKLLGYNDEVDIDKIKDELIESNAFNSINFVQYNEFGRENKELLISGEQNEENKEKIKDVEKKEDIKIYVIKE